MSLREAGPVRPCPRADVDLDGRRAQRPRLRRANPRRVGLLAEASFFLDQACATSRYSTNAQDIPPPWDALTTGESDDARTSRPLASSPYRYIPSTT